MNLFVVIMLSSVSFLFKITMTISNTIKYVKNDDLGGLGDNSLKDDHSKYLSIFGDV